MKKRTKFRLRNDLAVPFWISVSICLFCALLNFMLFYQNFFRALSKFNEEPIATITFKYKTAQRKFLDRVVWDRLRQNSPVYNGDTIHTAELSEATVWFEDGTILDLAESTMAQVFRHDDGTLAADLEKGSATVDSTESSGLTLSAASVQVNVKAGTKISATKNEDAQNVNLTVQKGMAELADGTTFAQGNTFKVDETGETKALLSVTTPLSNEKILYHTQELCPVHFVWNNSDNADSLVLKIAEDKDFTQSIQNFNVENLNEKTIDLPKGIYYWQLSASNIEEKCSGKIQIIQALKPELLTPATDYSYQYRKKTPSIRFIWTESESATAYNFAISRSPDMRNPIIEQRSSLTSSIISTLEKGTYYWQVTPYYVVNRTGLANPSEVSSFQINQAGLLEAPVQYTPTDGEFIDKSKGRITLSWRQEDEASSYKIVIASMQSLNFPTFTRETSENYITLSGSDVSSLKEGQYYWAVTQIDSEGNESPRSVVRSFYAINGEIEQRTIFPPENYTIWQPLLADMRFTWKTNLTFMQHIQIAKDSNFREVVFDSETSGSAFSGLSLDEGIYWWRITTTEGNFTSNTPGKMLSVVGEMNGPAQNAPNAATRAVVRPSESYTFRWDEVEGADYYRIKIYKAGESTPIYDENFISTPELSISLEDYDEGLYKWELQAFSYETESSSRRNSRLAATNFVLRKIRPVTLVSPESGTTIGGWEAIENPPTLKWKSAEKYSKASIILKRTGDKNAEPISIRQQGYSSQIPQLASGTYEWTVNAFTMDELDISAVKSSYFTIGPIPPFDMPSNAKTEDGSIFNAEYLRRNTKITFSWDKVPRAYSYILEVYTGKKKRILREILDGNENTRFELTDLTILDKGDFHWKVRAVRMSDDKKRVLIDGTPAESMFTIDFTLNSSGASRKRNGEFYAQ